MAGSTRSYEIAKRMVDQGFKVTIISCKLGWMQMDKQHNYPSNYEGIDIIWLDIDYSNKLSYRNRIKVFIKYILGSLYYGIKIKANIIYASSGPLTICLPAIVIKYIQNIPIYFEVRDLWPEAPIQLKAINNKTLQYIAYKLEKLAYLNSKLIIGLSPGMVKGIMRVNNSKNVIMIPNFCNNEKLISNSFVKRKKLKVIYFGTVGLANNINYVVDALNHLIGIKDIVIDIYGEGKKLDEITKRLRCINTDIINIYKPFKKSELLNILKEYDISLIIFKNNPVLGTCSPNKLFDSISVGLPFIVNVKGWMSEMALRDNVGFYVDGDKPYQLANLLKFLISNRILLEEKGLNAKRLALKEFDKNKLITKLLSNINQ